MPIKTKIIYSWKTPQDLGIYDVFINLDNNLTLK